MATIATELAFASIKTLGAGLRRRDYTAVQLAEFFLDRLEKLGPKYNALVTLTPDVALTQADQADRELSSGMDRGPLHGIPYGAKDLLATVGAPTSWGAAPLKDQFINADATAIIKLRDAGAVLIGKLAMVEIAGGLGYVQANASFTGAGLNPWSPDSWSGGSSSGSGSAVAAGLCPFAIGSETWGSIMTPAGYCGITGLRPTYGLVSRAGAMALCWSLDRLGPLGRTAEDCMWVTQALSGYDPLDPATLAALAPKKSRPLQAGQFRLAVLPGAAERMQPEVRQNYEAALEVFRQGSSLQEVSPPDLPYGAVASTLIDCEMAAAFESLVTDGRVWQMSAPEDRYGAHANLMIPAKDYINAQRIRGIIQREIARFMEPFDAVIVPTLSTVAPPIDRSFASYQGPWSGETMGGAENAAGIPAITVPSGFGERGLPTAIKLIGPAWSEANLAALANYYQEQTLWHAKYPQIPGA